jgi:diacylglycerol kinase family enzyme
MARQLKVAVIVNPAAHKGGAARRWSAIQAELIARLGPFEPRFTAAPGHATELARAARRARYPADLHRHGRQRREWRGRHAADTRGEVRRRRALDLIEMGNISPLAMLTTVLPKVYSGGHVHHTKVRVSRGTSFRFEAVVETMVDLDGETVGRLLLGVSVVPGGFRVGNAVGPPR